MKKPYVAIVFATVVGFAGLVYADQVKVNIVYPINGGTYPASAYFTSSFSVTCSGDHKVEWGFDTSGAVGSATFYDQISAQFVHKLPGGPHSFWVKSDCGDNRVKFQIG